MREFNSLSDLFLPNSSIGLLIVKRGVGFRVS
jgi:hypothetical protein